jgi:D-alanyl-D-alanine dipeptidase
MFKLNGLAILFLFFNSCKPKQMVAQVLTEAPKTAAKVKVVSIPNPVNDTTFVSIKEYSSDFVFDMKYASPDNFLINANNEFITRGFRIKLYDCYRPLDIQKKMWKIVSNPMYVADPKKGSIHNRGGAVDITLVDKNGNELDMGTKFDHFGKEAGHNYLQLSENVLENRTLLREVMLNNGFTAFESEWWHYNSIDGNLLPLANFKWQCN